ncbi:MAG TPA: fibronectin type III domain-containing protein, partial [Flavisolibacter sp.]|nr:fibronectin type III domain-containing protein [Flavisolibacter sp.]
TASTLPNNDPVQYDVYVGATLKATNITQTAYTAAGLTPKTAYQIKVVAKSAEGKSTEKILAAQTADNVAPVTFTAQEVDHGFSNVRLKWNAAVDANNDSLSYFLSRNGILTPLTEVPVSGIYTYVVKNLSASTAYSVSIVAKDPYGGEAVSNTVQGTTNAGPANDFLFTAKNSGSNVELEWIQSYPGQFDPATSSYIINGVEKSLSTVQVSFLNTGSGLYVKIILPAADFPDNTQRPIKLKLGWGANENTTQSRTVNHTRYFLSATTALVSSAVLKTYSNGDKGYVLTFANDKISDFSTWNVVEVKFENCIQPGTVSLQFPTGQTVQSVFGGLPQNDYDYLKTRSEGYLVVQDAGGYHRLNFSYTVL